MLRQQPEGTPLLKLRREGSPWPSRPYVITEAGSDRVFAILEPAGVDWIVLDGDRNPVAHIEELKGTFGSFLYRARVGTREVCRYTWSLLGLGVWTAELQVEFSPPDAGEFDRALALACAPILEAQARRASQRLA